MSNLAVQTFTGPVQLIPAGVDVMAALPCPLPIARKLTVSDSCSLNVAVTVVAALSVTAHVVLVLPEQPPPAQPANLEVAFGVAVSVATGSPVVLENGALQIEPQRMAEVASVTVPPPVPFSWTVRVKVSCPVPVRVAASAPPSMFRDADFAPELAGANSTVTTHDAPAASVFPAHWSAVMANSPLVVPVL
jgi:hypothetical protein